MSGINRRKALAIMGSATAALLVPRPSMANPVATTLLADLAERITRTPRDGIFDLAVTMAAEGVTYRDMLAATFLAGLQEIRPRHVGGKLHAVLMVAAAFELAERTGLNGAWQVALWNLDDFKNAQKMDKEGGDWHLSPLPEIPLSREKAEAELQASMEAWDDTRADRAIVALLPHLDHQGMFEVIWPLAARCYINIGHKIIFASQLERALRRVGWAHAAPALRSLIHGLLFQGRTGPQMEAFNRSRQLLAAFPPNWQGGRSDPQQSLAILQRLRGSGWQEAQDMVLAALKDGFAPESIWDGLRLYAAELFLHRLATETPAHREALLPVHAVTVTHAFGHAWRTTAKESTKQLMLLQATAYLAFLHRDLGLIVGLREGAEGLDTLGDSGTGLVTNLAAEFDALTPARAQAFLNANPHQNTALLDHMRAALIAGALEHHQFKLAGAIQEESTRVHSTFTSRILSPAVGYLVDTGTRTERLDRIGHALQRIGIPGR